MSLEKFAKRFVKKANSMAEGVAEYVSNKQSLHQLNSELSAANEQLQLLFADLGRLRFHGSAALAGVRSESEILEDIMLAREKISKIENELDEYHKKDESTSTTDQIAASVYCHKCGAPQADDNEFCPKCGTHLSK